MSHTSRGPEAAESPWASMAFWLGLLIAMAAFAAAALAPRFVVWTSLTERYEGNQRELIELEQQIAQLDRVADALEADPEFASALARAEFGDSAAQGRLIPVDDALVFDPWRLRETPTRQTRTPGWWFEAAKALAADTKLRRQLFAFASLLVLLMFSAGRLVAAMLQALGLLKWIQARYVRSPTGVMPCQRSRNPSAKSDLPEKLPFSGKSLQAARSSLPNK